MTQQVSQTTTTQTLLGLEALRDLLIVIEFLEGLKSLQEDDFARILALAVLAVLH